MAEEVAEGSLLEGCGELGALPIGLGWLLKSDGAVESCPPANGGLSWAF